MKPLLTDPVVLICSGIIVIGLIGFFWAVGKFRRLEPTASPVKRTDGLFSPDTNLSDLDFRAPAMGGSAETPPVSRDVADRLESMTQRLTEMQSVLMKQSSGPSVAGAPVGGVGQGFSPETVEKLLKIIGNVIQQVDVLQKSLNVAKET